VQRERMIRRSILRVSVFASPLGFISLPGSLWLHSRFGAESISLPPLRSTSGF
jgi:hypothetical protein